MRLAPPLRLGVALTGALLVAGCLAPHDVPLVNVWVVNTGTEDRVIVYATGPLATAADVASGELAFLIPADGFPRSTPGATLDSPAGSLLSILVFDLDCTLLDSVEVRVGSYLITLGVAEMTVAELARSTEPTGAQLAAPAPAGCTAGAPP
jgi:hypothetical protein